MTDNSLSAGVFVMQPQSTLPGVISRPLPAARLRAVSPPAPLALAVAMLVLAMPPVVRAAEISDHPVSSGYLKGKIQYCTYCHGSSGQGYRGYYSMPRLAGQTPEYFINQMRAYAERQRQNRYMYTAAHGLSPSTRSALARHFAGLHPGANEHGPRGAAGEGRRIYQEGLPNSNIPACAACHGPEGQGSGQNPRLAGQLYAYTQKTLANWKAERTSGGSPGPASIMEPIARSMSTSQQAAVAAYLGTLK